MQNSLFGIMVILGYASGLLVWPACLLLWRKKRRRTTASRWIFVAELVCQLVVVGFFVFSHGILEHQYYWCMVMILVNLGFTPLALGAALYDCVSEKQTHAS